MRLVDVTADGRAYGAFDVLHGAADGATFSKQLKSATEEVFGVAGPEFVRLLITDKHFSSTRLSGKRCDGAVRLAA